jgi:hypothetical protein
VPHRFIANYDDDKGYLDSFRLFPISEEDLKLEIEQWKIFVQWHQKYESGEVGTETHPGHGGISERWDEIEKLLKSSRETIPGNALLAKANFEFLEEQSRYQSNGPSYKVAWSIVDG